MTETRSRATKLQLARSAQGLTRWWLATESGVSYERIVAAERRGEPLTAEQVDAVAKALGAYDLFDDSRKPAR